MAKTKPDPGLQLQPTVHVGDMAASIAFYEQLGGEIIHGGREADWVLMQLGTIQIALVARPPHPDRGESPVQLTFAAEMPLGELRERLRRAGFAATEVSTDLRYGELLKVRNPDGLLIKITQREPDWPDPIQPDPIQPEPIQPDPIQPELHRPAPSQPAPAQQRPHQPAPTRPEPPHPAPGHPAPGHPAPSRLPQIPPTQNQPAPHRRGPNRPEPNRRPRDS